MKILPSLLIALIAIPAMAGNPIVIPSVPADGTYVLVVKNGGVVSFEKASVVDIGVIPDDPTPPVPPVPVVDMKAAINATLAKVTDAGKSVTAKALAASYKEAASAEGISDFNVLGTLMGILTTTSTSGKAGWDEFSKLMDGLLKASTSMSQTKAILNTAAGELEKIP